MMTDEQMIEKARARGIADKDAALFFGRSIEKLVIDAERTEYRRLLQLQKASWERARVVDVEAERERCAAEFVGNGRAIGRLEEREACAKLADDLGHFGLRDAILGRTHAL